MKKSSRRSRPSIAAYIVAGLMVVLYGSPLVFLLLGSGQQAGTLPSVSPASVTQFRVDNYVDYFVLYGNGPALYNSLLIALGTTTVIMVLGPSY